MTILLEKYYNIYKKPIVGGLQMKKIPIFRKEIQWILSAFLLVLCAFFIFQIYQDVELSVQLKSEYKEAEQLLLTLEAQKETLSEEKLKLEDPAYVKRYARGKYMVTKEGEQVFKLPSKDD